MKLTIEPTERIGLVDGVQSRYWTGVDEHGVEVEVLVRAVAPLTHDKDVAERYETELEVLGFSVEVPIDIRMVL